MGGYRGLLLAGCAAGVLLAAAAVPALADGGMGGAGFGGTEPGAAGGIDSTTGTGMAGTSPASNAGAGGGGAGTTQGGDGGTAPGMGFGVGGSGGTGAGGNGGFGGGGAAGNDGGSGGGGGTAGLVAAGTATSGRSVSGGNGGGGGFAFALGAGGGGGGGGGGYGAIISGGTYTVTGAGGAAGGSGGNGGDGGTNTGRGGNGGSGGIGVFLGSGAMLDNAGAVGGGSGGFGGNSAGTGSGGNGGSGGIGVLLGSGATLVNSGSVDGGSGGSAGTSVGGNGSAGAGGVGVRGSGVTIINSGAISGGLGGDGVTRANAIVFTGGTNTLTLEAGSSITGSVVAFSAADTLALGGSGNASFDVSQIGAAAQYQGFGIFQKTGSSTWTLTNTTSAVTPWTISAGTLRISADGALGDTSGGLTFNGGTLQWGVAFTLSALRSITLDAGGGTFDTNGFTSTIGVGISGSGGLTKNGAGLLMLGAANSYTGGTTLNAGTLQVVSGASLASTGAVTVNGGTLDFDGNTQTIGSLAGGGGTLSLGPLGSIGGLTVNQSANASYDGNISGTGSFTKTGTGTLILNGTNTYSGPTTVTGGTLEIGDASHTGASLASDVTVGANGALAGHGSLLGSVTNTGGGILAPGGSVGTLTVGGNYTQGATSSLKIEVSPAAASKLAVGSIASLAGTLVLVYDPGLYVGKTYTILSASNVSGSFSTLAGTAPPGFAQSIGYGTNSVMLTLDPLAPTNSTVYIALGTAMLENAQQANGTLLSRLGDLRSGESGALHTALAASRPVQLALNGGAGLDELLAQLPEQVASQGGWVRAAGRFATLDGSGGVPGFDTRSGGFLAGFDREFAPHIAGGVAAGYGFTSLSQQDAENGTVSTPRLALYGSYAPGRVAFDATLGYAHDFIDAKRPLVGVTASSTHDGDEANAALQASTRLDLGAVTVVPSAGLDYVHLAEAGFTESGAPGFDLAVSHRSANSLHPFIAADAAESFATAGGAVITPSADIAYSHETLNAAPSNVASVGGGTFIINGLVPARDEVTIGAAIAARMSERLTLAAAYQATLPTGNLFAQTVEAGLRFRF